MKLAKWLKECAKRREAYERACNEGARLLAHYDQTGEGLSELCANTLLIDRLYLAWCEAGRWETEP